jgi:anion-transporting  ArsA/GET3 family ATPase
LKILTKPYGGLNEILAIVELNMQFQSKKFDVIVLDTPPGSHFLDFLDSVERIKVFFDQSFIEIFQYLGKKLDTSKYNVGKKMMNIIMSSGIKKLLSYLNKVTGDKFIDDFIEAIIAIYKTKATFLEALDLQQTIKNDSYSNWYLVTSVEQNKLQEALELKNHAKGHFTDKSYIAINKCMGPELVNWETVENSQTHQLKNSLKERENKLKNNLNKHFNNVLEFPEIFEISPIEHIRKLTHSWRRYGEV